jgi:3-(3-hydroxy-phenyl)propionate hydroxylase
MTVLAELHRETECDTHGYPQASMFEQPELEALLRTNLTRYPSATLRGGLEVTALTQDDDGPVRVDVTDRLHGTSTTLLAAYVLGCDGANSTARAAIGSPMLDMAFDQRWLVVDVDTPCELGAWEGVHQVCDAGRAGTYMRIGDTRYRWEFRLGPTETADDYRDITRLQPLIAGWTKSTPLDQLHIVRVAEYTFRAQIADRWRAGNVFILGDAAHLTPPFIGQGMGAGMRDAHNLAWKVAGVLRGQLSPEDLDSYQEERKPHARAMIQLALAVGRAMTAGGELGSVLRRVVVPRLGLIPGVRSRIVDSSTPALHRSSFVQRRLGPRSLAGTLCPNPTLPDGRRLDDVLGTGFAIVTAVPFTPDQQAVADQRCATVFFAAPGSDLARWLRRGRTTIALVRPDRTVMATARRPADLLAHTPPFAISARNRSPTER